MASFKDFYTEQGKHCLQVTTERDVWVEYQAQMIYRARLPWFPSCQVLPKEQSIVYDLSECIAISAYPILPAGELEKVAEALRKFTEACKPYLLSAGSCSRELKHIFWNTRTAQLQCIYIPERSRKEPEEWRQDIWKGMIQNAVEQCWPEEELLSCYRFYLAVGKGEKAVAAEEKQERAGIAEQQIHAAKMARFALWDELADEEDEEEESAAAVQRVKGKVRQFFSRKEK